jgi:hypothetical protein
LVQNRAQHQQPKADPGPTTDAPVPAAKDGLLRAKELAKLAFWKTFAPRETGRTGQSRGRNVARFALDAGELELTFDQLGRLELASLVLTQDPADESSRAAARAFLRDFVGPGDRAGSAVLADQLSTPGNVVEAAAAYFGSSESATMPLPTSDITFDHLPGSQRRLRLQIQRTVNE